MNKREQWLFDNYKYGFLYTTHPVRKGEPEWHAIIGIDETANHEAVDILVGYHNDEIQAMRWQDKNIGYKWRILPKRMAVIFALIAFPNLKP